MACFGNKQILIKIDELPVINGEHIESIYKKFYNTDGVDDPFTKEENKKYYFVCYPYFRFSGIREHPIQIVRNLPDELNEIFNINKNIDFDLKLEVTSLSYSTSDTGNGSCTDYSISIDGINNGNSQHHYVTRTHENEHSKLGKLLFSTLNKKYTIPVLEEHEYRYYPSTTLRRVDYLNYPDFVCSGWRRSNKMPYVSRDNKLFRILFESQKLHVYLEKVNSNDLEINQEYVRLSFDRENPESFCNIYHWSDTNEIAKYVINKFTKNKFHNTKMAECSNLKNDKIVKGKELLTLDNFYILRNIKNVNNLE